MTSVRRISAVVLFLALAITLPAYAQRERGNNGRKDEKKADRGKPDRGTARADRGSGRERFVERREDRRERVVPVRRGEAYGHDRLPPGQAKKIWGDHSAREWAHEHQTWRMRGGYRGYRVPHERFVAYFGPRHYFRIHAMPMVVVAGHPRFHCNGFWFTLVDPWPEYWAADWYETDDVYVDYVDDGYYLFNRRRPGIAIAVNISL